MTHVSPKSSKFSNQNESLRRQVKSYLFSVKLLIQMAFSMAYKVLYDLASIFNLTPSPTTLALSHSCPTALVYLLFNDTLTLTMIYTFLPCSPHSRYPPTFLPLLNLYSHSTFLSFFFVLELEGALEQPFNGTFFYLFLVISVYS